MSSRGRQAREIQIVNAIAGAFNSTPDVQQALERTLALVADWLGLQTGWIWLVDPETCQFYSAAVQNLPPYLQQPVHMTGHSCWCIDDFRAGKLTPSNVDVMECSRLRSAVQAHVANLTRDLRYHASIPLYCQDKPLGIMNITGPSWRKLASAEMSLLSTVANQVGIAIERSRLAEASTRLARAEERARLAREIHDTLAQHLTAIALQLESAMRHLEFKPQRARERLEQALTTTREGLEEARRSVLDLRAAPLAGKSLAEALGALARAFTHETGVRVRVGAGGVHNLSLRVEAELYRIAQEALTNVRKHARAEEVHMALRVDSGIIRLSIRDDGHGLQPGARREGHHGILGMRERARLIGGSLRIESRPGRGTRVVASVPIKQPEEA